MRHRKSGRHLNRTSAHRKAMFTNMAVSLIEHEAIRTTPAKAKELRRKVEPLITLAKEDSVANRRLAFSRLRSKHAVGKLFQELGPRYKARPGGYTRILKAGYRAGDATMVAYVEFVGRPRTDYEEEEAPAVEDSTTESTEESVTEQAASTEESVSAEETEKAVLNTESPAEDSAETATKEEKQKP